MEEYESFRREFYHKCIESMSTEDSAIAASVLDSMMQHYDIVTKDNSLTVYTGDGLPQVVEYYLDCCRIKNLSDKTIQSYKQRIKYFMDTVQVNLVDVKRIHIRQFLYVLEQKGLKSSSIARYYSALSALFTWMVDEELITANPMHNIEKLKVKKANRQPLSDIDVEKLRNACENDRERAILEFMLCTGVRVSELCNVKMSNIHWDEKQADLTPVDIINGKGGKDRKVYIKDLALVHIKEYLGDDMDGREYLFENNGHKYSRGAINWLCKKLKETSGITKDFSPHICRHTMATRLAKNADLQTVQAVLGHTNMNTTMIYAHTDQFRVVSDLARFG